MLILHGDDILSSRRKLWQEIAIRKRVGDSELITIEGKNLDLNLLKQNLEASSLFLTQRLIVIENLFSGQVTKTKEQAIDYLKDNRPKNIIIWENKKIDGRKILKFKDETLLFALPRTVFNFLDSLAPGKGKLALFAFHRLIKKEPIELVFYLLFAHISYLIIARDRGMASLKNLPVWKSQKLIFQAKKFPLEGLLALYHRLLNIEYRCKSGQSPLSLLYHLEVLLLTL